MITICWPGRMKKESIQDRKNWEQTHLEEIPSKPKFLLLKQQKLLSVLLFNIKTEYKPQLLLNKKLLKQLYTTLVFPGLQRTKN